MTVCETRRKLHRKPQQLRGITRSSHETSPRPRLMVGRSATLATRVVPIELSSPLKLSAATSWANRQNVMPVKVDRATARYCHKRTKTGTSAMLSFARVRDRVRPQASLAIALVFSVAWVAAFDYGLLRLVW